MLYDSNSNEIYSIPSNFVKCWWCKDGILYGGSLNRKMLEYDLVNDTLSEYSFELPKARFGYYKPKMRKDSVVIEDGHNVYVVDYDLYLLQSYDLSDYSDYNEIEVLLVDTERIVFSCKRNGKKYFIVLNPEGEWETEPFEIASDYYYVIAANTKLYFYDTSSEDWTYCIKHVYDIADKEWSHFNGNHYWFDRIVDFNSNRNQFLVEIIGVNDERYYYLADMDDLQTRIHPLAQ